MGGSRKKGGYSWCLEAGLDAIAPTVVTPPLAGSGNHIPSKAYPARGCTTGPLRHEASQDHPSLSPDPPAVRHVLRGVRRDAGEGGGCSGPLRVR